MASHIEQMGSKPSVKDTDAEPTSFHEFLEQKAREYKITGQRQRREQWLESVTHLLKEIRGWLDEEDPKGLLEVTDYNVARYERGVGSYEAPALKIRLGPSEVDILPISYDSLEDSLRDADQESASFKGRVDITDGMNKCNFLQKNIKGQPSTSWQIRCDRNPLIHLNKDTFVKLLWNFLK